MLFLYQQSSPVTNMSLLAYFAIAIKVLKKRPFWTLGTHII